MQKGWKIAALIVGTVLPALITSYFSYKQAQVEADAGYKALVGTVDELQKQVQDHHDRLLVLETVCLRVDQASSGKLHHKSLPSNLHEAYQMGSTP
jgi:hypothetical protein